MEWIPINKATLVKGKIINFIELNKPQGIFPETQTIHKGWFENGNEFYSECADNFIKIEKVTHINLIPKLPNCFLTPS